MGIETTKKLAYLAETKSLIKAALIEKGQAVSDTDTFRSYADKVMAIETGGGSVEGVHYVTFMSQDGTTELFKRPVADGDDCADPVARGLISAPTKESTAQYNYPFVGWATTPNGAWDENALKAVTDDRTVYAAFASAVRYYTVSFYDGETLLATKQVAYGGSITYVPDAKDGYAFSRWEPVPENITGNTSCYAQWVMDIDFATASWAEIASVAQSGKAAEVFSVGDTKTITANLGSSTVNIPVMIVGFNHDTLSDGVSKAGISFLVNNMYSTAIKMPTASYSDIQSTLDEYYNYLPSDLRAVIKPVRKTWDNSTVAGTSPATKTITSNLWIPSVDELGRNAGTQNVTALGSPYELFPTWNNELAKCKAGTQYWTYWTRTRYRNGSLALYIVKADGTASTTTALTSSQMVRYGFCV